MDYGDSRPSEAALSAASTVERDAPLDDVTTTASDDVTCAASGDVIPTSAASDDVTPTSAASDDVTPTPAASDEVTPTSGASGDVIHTSAASGDVIPTSAAGGDVTPASAASGDVIARPAASGDVTLDVDDFFIMKASTESYVSTRSRTHGSPFIRILVATFYRHCCHRDLESIFKIIQERVRESSKRRRKFSHWKGGVVPQGNSTFTHYRKLYFFPKYPPSLESRQDSVERVNEEGV